MFDSRVQTAVCFSRVIERGGRGRLYNRVHAVCSRPQIAYKINQSDYTVFVLFTARTGRQFVLRSDRRLDKEGSVLLIDDGVSDVEMVRRRGMGINCRTGVRVVCMSAWSRGDYLMVESLSWG